MANKNEKRKKARLFDIKHFFMDIGRIVCFFMPLWFRLKTCYVSREAKKKLRGGAIIASNHTSFADPLIAGCSFWYRRMFFLVAEVVMKNKIMRFFLKGIGCIEINRNICDMDAIRKSVSLLKEGHVMLVFPQGGIDREKDASAIKSGIVLMAMQSGVPVVPVYIERSKRIWQRNRVMIGEPIAPPTPGAMARINFYAQEVLEQMTVCKEKLEETRRNKNGNS